MIRLARPKKPYNVHCMQSKDFLDLMGQSRKLRVLTVWQGDEGEKVNWPSRVEFMVLKKEGRKLFFKTSHLCEVYSSISLARTDKHKSKAP